MPSPSLRPLLLLLTLPLLSSCMTPGPGLPRPIQTLPSTGSTTPTVATEPLFCAEYKPVQWSTKDTDLTKQQIQANNLVFHKLCPS